MKIFRNIHFIIGAPVLIFAFLSLARAQNDMEIIRHRVIEKLLEPEVNDIHVEQLMTEIRKDGSWPDINYEDVSRTGFQNGRHLDNLIVLSRDYKKKDSEYQGNRKLKKVIFAALDYWLDHDFICDNWWWNQIGTPSRLISVLLIMDDDLTPWQKTRAIPVVDRANMSASGARPSGDRIKIAGILAKNALFRRDSSLFDRVIRIIQGEIKFATGRGLQYDYSFHHRKDRVTNTISYGTGYANAAAEWAAYVAGTKYRFADRKLKLLTDYYLDGICKTMVFGKYPDPGAKNRSITRPGALKAFDTQTPENLLKAGPYRKHELEEIIGIRKGVEKPSLSFSTFFWQSEYYSHQRPDHFTSVRMYSTRNHNMEQPYNGEGLMNHHLGDGNNFISRTGTEYYNIFPVYDWQKIPGTTVVQKPVLPPAEEIQQKGLTDFAGAVTDGRYGAVGFDFKSPWDPLTARKAWFFFDHAYVCLGAGITSSSPYPVVTTLNQCLLKGKVMIKHNGKEEVLDHGSHDPDRVEWVFHDSVAYLFPKPVRIKLKNDTASGSWSRINHQSDSPKEKITKNVFMLWLDHGKEPRDEKYQYIVVPSTGPDELRNSTVTRDMEILSNTPVLQAVKNKPLGICQLVFYRPGKVKISDKLNLAIDQPGIVMLKLKNDSVKEVSVSDPSRKLKELHLTISGKVSRNMGDLGVVWDEKKGVSVITVRLPQGVYAGKSITGKPIKNWQQMKTAEDVYKAYPERMNTMLRAMNLNNKGLEEVREAYNDNNILLACRELLNYYQNKHTVATVRKEKPPVSEKTVAKADSIIQDIFTFQRVSGKVPRLADGHLDWNCTGPENDMEWAWALNRHYPVQQLLDAWYKTGNPGYARYIDRFIKDWIISSWPYPEKKSSTAMWRGLEVSFREKVWAQVFYGMMNSGYLSPATRLLILASLPDHADYARYYHASRGNWLTMEMTGLATVATAWPEYRKSPEWLDYSIKEMTQSLRRQVYDDGAQTELTSHYHRVALINFAQFQEICKHAHKTLPDYYGKTLEKMYNYLACTMRPDGYGLLNNDSDRDYTRDFIRKAAAKYHRKDWEFIASCGKSGIEPADGPSFFFPWAGQLISRSGYDPKARWSFFDIGPWGTGHQHNDKLHISIAAFGHDFLVDGGRFAYRGEVARKFRRYATGSRSHNVILIDGCGQAPGPERAEEPFSGKYYKITGNFDYACNSFDRFIDLPGNARHTRALFYVRGNFWIIADHITTDRPRKIDVLWHWHPDCKVKVLNDHIVSANRAGGTLMILPAGKTNWKIRNVKGQEDPDIQGWYSPVYNVYEPNTASIYSTSIETGKTFVWILYPSEGKIPEIRTRILSQDANAVKVEVKVAGRGVWVVTIPFSDSSKALLEYNEK